LKALLLAAGHGKRLRQLTENRPKPLIAAGGLPLIYYSLYTLKKAGITEIIINLHYRGDQIKSFLGTGDRFKFNISYSDESEILGTGGAIKRVEPFFEGETDFVIINSDIITDFNLRDLINFHTDKKLSASLAVKEGVKEDLFYDEDLNLLSIDKKTPDCSSGVFTGIQVVSREIFDYTEIKFSSSIEAYKNYIKEKKPIKVFPLKNSFWYDSGIIDRLPAIEKTLKSTLGDFLEEIRCAFPKY